MRRLVLVGTGPRCGVPMTQAGVDIFGATYDPPEHLWLAVHFSTSQSSQAAGLEFLKRKNLRKEIEGQCVIWRPCDS